MKSTSIAVVRSAPMFLWVLVALLLTQYPQAVRADTISDGKAAFATCASCHTVTGANSLGPHLNGVVGRKAGSVAGFSYSPAMKRSSIVWNTATLEQYMQNPQEIVPGNRMPFAGVQDEKQRDDIAAYLATLH